MLDELKDELKTLENLDELYSIKSKYFGKKGLISEKLKSLSKMSIEDKKNKGKEINVLKDEALKLLNQKEEELKLKEIDDRLKEKMIDITLPSKNYKVGIKHPLNRVSEELEELFISMGYDLVSGPEVELNKYNFFLLNIPENHPARDSQDTFYISDDLLLRTQTSAVQAREMEKRGDFESLKLICPGKVYRRDDDDKTHSHQFMQMEGLVIGKNITLADLKGTMEIMAKKIFNDDLKIRFRTSYFPFTEPSFEVDVSCFKCRNKKECSICKNTGWIEILGAGMVHPNVLKMSGIDPEKYSGFAFGLGIERIAMLKYGISDIRDFYTNNVEFLNNYKRMED